MSWITVPPEGIEKTQYWDQVQAWNVPPKLLPGFLKLLNEFSSPISFQGQHDGRGWAADIQVKDAGDVFVVTARTISYPYCDNQLKHYLEQTKEGGDK
jgi:hypothetical protein